MAWQKAALFMAGFAVAVVLFAHQGGDWGEVDQTPNRLVPVVNGPGTIPTSQADADQRAAAASSGVSTAGQTGVARYVEQGIAADNSRRQAFEEAVRAAGERAQVRRTEANQTDTQRLLEAGFSQARIDSLRQRRDELLAQMERAAFERNQNGGPENPSSYAAFLDNDLLLREEMSDAEYMRYRQALGKATAVDVNQVRPGSYADQAGIKPGDQVVRFGAKRVFDYRELDALATTNDTPSGSTAVEVLRGAQTIMVALPKGPTGLSGPGSIATEILNRAMR
jgi:hypothetical protein